MIVLKDITLEELAERRAEQLRRIGGKAREASEAAAETGRRSIWLDDCAARVTISEEYIAGVVADILAHTEMRKLQGDRVVYMKPGTELPQGFGLYR